MKIFALIAVATALSACVPSAPKQDSGKFTSANNFACAVEDGIDKLADLPRGDFIAGMAVMKRYGCFFTEVGMTWEVKERGWKNTLVYAYRGPTPSRVYVRNKAIES